MSSLNLPEEIPLTSGILNPDEIQSGGSETQSIQESRPKARQVLYLGIFSYHRCA